MRNSLTPCEVATSQRKSRKIGEPLQKRKKPLAAVEQAPAVSHSALGPHPGDTLQRQQAEESIVGLEKCSPGDWIILIGFCVVCFIVTYFSVKIIKSEQALKIKAGYQLGSSDLEFTKNNVAKVVGIGLCGGIASGAFGLGGGAIFNPVLLYLGLPPKVVSATSMYMIMYSTTASSFVYITFGTLNIPYGLWISLFSAIGTILGLKILDKVMTKYERQSPIVIILVFLLALAALMVPIFGVTDVLE
eukprot:CAMPEP_0170544552 /NCGR_PEP_ID=MMETSP0211-20121228/3266_1 /TAXON_ID=311385 /ORGANISM="Pseudokeronopsis sp., Strain OXSARD2" /LENGTH=245 /DNA_ID=CAMNT_0010848221 /DNA_START=969 /DNA_END=1708 /DNA_ORIENTATION=-